MQYTNREGQGRKYQPGDKIGPFQIKLLSRIGKQKGLFVCPFDGKEFEAYIASIQSGSTKSCGCQRYIHSKENGQSTIPALQGQVFGHLTVIEPTKLRNGGNHVLWKCKCDCDPPHYIYVRSYDLLNQKVFTCPNVKTNKSKGEQLLCEILDELNVIYVQQYTFKKCINPKTKHKLRFDFYLPDYNCCIEYDGQQHFEESTMCSDTLEDRQYRDSIKNQYCKNNNIKLIRIPYWNYNKLNEEYLIELIEDVF